MRPSVIGMLLLVAALACLPPCLAQDEAERHPVKFWQLLMANPAGRDTPAPRGCQQGPQDSCTPGSSAPDECCASADNVCYSTGTCCSEDGKYCDTPEDCCPGLNFCDGNACGQGCFSRDTKVRVKGSPEPVALRDLRVGEHLLCYETGPDMMTPGPATWCEVMNFFRADDTTNYPDMVRLTVRGLSSGVTATSTVSWLHLMHLVTDAAPRQLAATAGELGAFEHDIALNTKLGQLTPLPTSSGLNTTYELGVIEAVEVIEALGKMIPAVEYPLIWADGIVQPIWPGWFRPVERNVQFSMTFPVHMAQTNALRHMVHAPLWMTRLQQRGTPGQHAQWDGQQRAPLMETLTASLEGRGPMPVSGAANFTRALEWFAPRYQAWKADPSKAITEAEVLAVWPSLFGAPDSASCPGATAANCPSEQVYLYNLKGLKPLEAPAASTSASAYQTCTSPALTVAGLK